MNNENIETRIIDTKEKLNNISITLDTYQEKMLLETIKRLKNPFINISVQESLKT